MNEAIAVGALTDVGMRRAANQDAFLAECGVYVGCDGMGGENYGEMASYAAAKTMQGFRREWFPNAQEDEARLRTGVGELNAAVMAAQQEHHTDRMGTTLVGLYLGRKHIYAWNVGDSRCYLLREGTLRQLSRDHVETLIRPGDPHPAR